MLRTDLRQARTYCRYMESLGWQVAGGAFIKKLPLLPFSIIKIQRPDNLPNLAALKKFRPIYIVYEPTLGAKSPKGFRPATPLLPSKTIRLKLNKSLPQLLMNMHPKTRYNIKKHHLPIKVWRGDKVPAPILKSFFEIYQNNSRRQHFWGVNFTQLKSLIKCFNNNAHILIARRMAKLGGPPKRDPLWVFSGEKRSQGLASNDIIGGLLILVHDHVAYYSHNAATREGRHQFAPTLLTWEAIRLAKKLNCHTFDFEGITDERFPLTKKWLGFTRFKKGFGGRQVSYPGAFERLGFLPANSGGGTRN